MVVTTTPAAAATPAAPRLIRTGIIVLILAAILTATAYAFGYRVNLQTGSVPVPTAAATPEQVVIAYIDAYNYRDFTTMAAVYPSAQAAYSRTRAMGTMRDVQITKSSPATAADLSGKFPTAGHDYYTVQVTLDYTGLTGSDLAYQPGPNGWTYWLERTTPGEPWTIIDSGNG